MKAKFVNESIKDVLAPKNDDELKIAFAKNMPVDAKHDIDDFYDYIKSSKDYIITKPLGIYKLNKYKESLNYSFDFETVDEYEFLENHLDDEHPKPYLKTGILKFSADLFMNKEKATLVFKNQSRFYYIPDHYNAVKLLNKIIKTRGIIN